MSKAYPSNLTRAQYELLTDLIPEQKPGGRPRTVAPVGCPQRYFRLSWLRGCQARALPGDFPAWQTVYT